MPVETAATPPLAARLRGVASSPVREILALTQRPGVISFAGGLPAPELFDAAGPARGVRRRAADGAAGARCSTRRPRATRRCAPRSPRGSRARPADPADELLITSGSQQALTLIATVLLEPGDAVLVEEPSYLAALQASSSPVRAVVPVPCDDDGLDPEALAALAAAAAAPSCSTRSRRSRTRRAGRCRSSAARRSWPLAPRRRPVARRGRSLRRAALPRRAAAARVAAAAPRTA